MRCLKTKGGISKWIDLNPWPENAMKFDVLISKAVSYSYQNMISLTQVLYVFIWCSHLLI